jgi:hypothetical protein
VSLSHRDLVRRVVILCCSFTRNVAYYRAGWAEQAQPLLSERNPKEVSFWRQVNGNLFDMAVLDWCKLFGDQKLTPTKQLGKHHWLKVVADPKAFEEGLLAQLRIDENGLASLITTIRNYRDKFVAHLDGKLVMEPPELAPAGEAVKFYHRYIVEREAKPGELEELPNVQQLALGYDLYTREAAQIYAAGLNRA